VGASDALPSAPVAGTPDSASAPVTLRIPVAGLDCGIGMMNRHLRHALHADRHPDIQFTLAEYELVPGDSGWTVRMDGRLSVAGVERPWTARG
jgi:polyisoprenoid-binding protein YceI